MNNKIKGDKMNKVNFKTKSKFAIFQMRDEWCESVAEFHEEQDKDDISVMLKVDSELEGYWLIVAYPNGKVLRDYICEESVQDCYNDMKKDNPKEQCYMDQALMVCVGWRIDEFRDQGYKADWLDDEEDNETEDDSK
jgi:hypothetical protein